MFYFWSFIIRTCFLWTRNEHKHTQIMCPSSLPRPRPLSFGLLPTRRWQGSLPDRLVRCGSGARGGKRQTPAVSLCWSLIFRWYWWTGDKVSYFLLKLPSLWFLFIMLLSNVKCWWCQGMFSDASTCGLWPLGSFMAPLQQFLDQHSLSCVAPVPFLHVWLSP